MNCFDEGYQEQFRNMTSEQIETHIGLEKVRNVMDGLPAEHGIKRIRKLIEQIQKQEAEKKKTQIKIDLENQYTLTDGYVCCIEEMLIK